MTHRRLSPEERVWVAVSMVDAVTRICADSERKKNPNITEKALISRLRKRFDRQPRTFGEWSLKSLGGKNHLSKAAERRRRRRYDDEGGCTLRPRKRGVGVSKTKENHSGK